MNTSEHLFELIKSLNKSEKGYFKKYTSLHVIKQGGRSRDDKRRGVSRNENNYVRLFDIIDRQKKNDEKKILKLYSQDGHAKRFAFTKHYLYNLILKSMDAYHYSINTELKKSLHQIEFLYEKGLVAHCKKIIIKAKQLAVKYEQPLPLLELLKWEIIMASSQSFAGTTEDEIKQLYNTVFETTRQYNTANEYDLLTELLFWKMLKKGQIRSLDEIPAIQKMHDKLLIRTNEKDLSNHALHAFYAMHFIYYSIQNDYKNVYIYQQKLVQLLEKNPHQIAEHPLQYMIALANLAISQIYLKKFNECADVIEKSSKIQIKSPVVKKYSDILIDKIKLSLCIYTGAFTEGFQVIKSIESKLDNHDSVMITKGDILLFQYNAAVLCFATGNYQKANEYINKILNEPVDTGNDIQCFTWILSLLVHFEMENQDLLEYRVKSVHRFLYKRNQLYKLETILLDFIHKDVPKINSDKALLKSFEILLKKIKPLSTDLFEQRAFDYFDFISWLESKIEKRSFVKIVREKAMVI